MLCKKCREHIEQGEAMRAEPVTAGSNQHHFYHCGCYSQVKAERQMEQGQLSLPLTQQKGGDLNLGGSE